MLRQFKNRVLVVMGLSVCLLLCSGICSGESPDATKILKEVDNALFPQSYITKLQMIDHKPNKKDIKFVMKVKSKKQVGSMMTFEYPPSEIGKKYLFKDRTIWMVIPGVSNPIRLSIKQSFMDSSFSNNDLMDSEFSDDYIPNLEDTVKVDNQEYYKIICDAKNIEVTYYKIVMLINKENLIPKECEYYSRSGMLIKTLEVTGIKEMAGRMRATKMVMQDKSAADEYTTVIIDSLEEQEFTASSFSLDALKR